MKKLIALVLALVCVLSLALSFTGCSTTVLQTSVYSFGGANEYFAISNGVIVLDDSTETFYGGTISAEEDFLLKLFPIR